MVKGTKIQNRSSQTSHHTSGPKANIYTTLDTSQNCIRILLLHSGPIDAPVVCELATISLVPEGHTEYEALSYCWGRRGKTSDRDEILMVTRDERNVESKVRIPVQSNLYQALVQLRPRSGRARTLWIDAVCINQDDEEERAQQVSQMRKIYAQASQVVVWLGSSNSSRKRVFERLKQIDRRLTTEFDADVIRDHDMLLDWERKVIMDSFAEGEFFRGGRFMLEISRCQFEYFVRTWIVQELANARRIIVYCGSDTTSWDVFPAVMRMNMTNHLNWIPHTRFPEYSLEIMPQALYDLTGAAMKTKVGKSHIGNQGQKGVFINRPGILPILLKCHALEATDPRDKIFAVLQFGEDTSNVAVLTPDIRPDYTKSTLNVFSDFVRWWICTHKSLDILSAVHTLRGRSWQHMEAGPAIELEKLPYPTWCLDLEHGGDASWIENTLALSDRSPYKASGDSRPDLELVRSINTERHPGLLRLAGCRLGTVSSIQPFPVWDFEQPLPLFEAFHRVFDCSVSKHERILDLGDQSKQDFKHIAPRGMKQRLDRHALYHRRGVQSIHESMPCVSFCKLVTEDGLPGLCPHYAKAGDIIVVLRGGSVLYLLRQSHIRLPGDNYEGQARFFLVGECWLDGHMYAADWQEVQSRGLDEEIFKLV